MKIKLDKLIGPAISLLVHCVVLFCAYKFIRFVIKENVEQIEVMVMEVESVDLQEFEDQLEQVEEMETFDDNVMSDEPLEAEAPEMDQPTETTDDFANLDVMSSFDSPIVMKGLYSSRSSDGRAAMLKKYGRHSKETERAVLKALDYLKRTQKPTGSWGKKQDGAHAIGTTGVALLAFLAHGETPSSDEYGATVEKAIRYLLSQQKPDGKLCSGGHETYGHAIGAYALAEAYAMTKIPKLKTSFEKGIDVIVKGLVTTKEKKVGSMEPVPGIDADSASEVTCARLEYTYGKRTRYDTSVLGWQAQALKAAKLAGSKNPKLKSAIGMTANGLFFAQNRENGRFRYSENQEGGSAAMTGVGVLCLQLLGHGKTAEVKAGLNYLDEKGISLKDKTGWFYYQHYYTTQAMFHHGPSAFTKWNNKFAPIYVKHQSDDGSFSGAGSFNPENHNHLKHGKEYSTSIAALTLMVYYRNLPTFQESAVEVEVEKPSDDVEIEII